tara:strand:- start:1989 stop:2444 length:456 start_codon:yes stop_codon:yes gene_type:complete
MDQIDKLFEINTTIDKKKLIFTFLFNGREFTDLRVIQFYHEMDQILKSLYDPKIKNLYFIFKIKEIYIPSNFVSIRKVADLLTSHIPILNEKLVFTIIQNDTNVFKTFFKLFKQYYVPVKPLYLCKTDEDVNNCLHIPEEREKMPNILNLL